jgi:hypothetical protein
MNPCGELRTTVMELGIESIMLRKDRKLKKIVMPLRVPVSLLFLMSFFHPTQLKHFYIFNLVNNCIQLNPIRYSTFLSIGHKVIIQSF